MKFLNLVFAAAIFFASTSTISAASAPKPLEGQLEQPPSLWVEYNLDGERYRVEAVKNSIDWSCEYDDGTQSNMITDALAPAQCFDKLETVKSNDNHIIIGFDGDYGIHEISGYVYNEEQAKADSEPSVITFNYAVNTQSFVAEEGENLYVFPVDFAQGQVVYLFKFDFDKANEIVVPDEPDVMPLPDPHNPKTGVSIDFALAILCLCVGVFSLKLARKKGRQN